MYRYIKIVYRCLDTQYSSIDILCLNLNVFSDRQLKINLFTEIIKFKRLKRRQRHYVFRILMLDVTYLVTEAEHRYI